MKFRNKGKTPLSIQRYIVFFPVPWYKKKKAFNLNDLRGNFKAEMLITENTTFYILLKTLWDIKRLIKIIEVIHY